MSSITNSSIRTYNRKKIVHLLFKEGEMTKLEISQRLDISVPTVTTIINDLIRTGLCKNGQILGSTGGRKASSFVPAYDARYALGADASEEGLHLVLLDLGGSILAKEYYPVFRDNTAEYWQKVDEILAAFAKEYVDDMDKLMDIGITLEVPMEDGKVLPGPDGETVDLDLARSVLSHQVTFRNSTKMAAIAQIWNQSDSGSFLFVKMSNTINASPVYQGITLDFSRVNGAIGSLLMPGAEKTIGEELSAKTIALRAGAKDRDDFTKMLDSRDEAALSVFDEYMNETALLLHNLNCLFRWKMVLGGAMAPLLRKHESELREKLEILSKRDPGQSSEIEFSELGEYAAAAGAAMLPIDHFLSELE